MKQYSDNIGFLEVNDLKLLEGSFFLIFFLIGIKNLLPTPPRTLPDGFLLQWGTDQSPGFFL
jgi:hypothetical protein